MVSLRTERNSARILQFFFRGKDDVSAWVTGNNGDENEGEFMATETVDGWVQIEVLNDQVVRGKFDLVFESGGLIGTFDYEQ